MTPDERHIICEPFAGSAAFTYGLVGGLNCKPPISYMGGKTGYREAIYNILGLRPGQKPAGIVLGEVGPWAAVHACLGGAVGVDAVEVGRFLHANALSMVKNGLAQGYSRVNGEGNDFTDRHGDSGHWHATTPEVSAARVHSPMPASKAVANIIRDWKDEPPRALWDRLKAEGWPSLLPVEGGRWLGPQGVDDVAKFLHANALSMVKNGLAQGYSRVNGEGNDFTDRHGAIGHWHATTPEVSADRIAGTPPFPPLAVWQGKAEEMALPPDLSGWIIYMDPPYQGTSGYPHGDCQRATVLALALDYSRRGAVVAISEAVGLADALGSGWWQVQIDHARKGQKRTFSKQQDEFLTLNRAPFTVPPKQLGMFSQGADCPQSGE